MVTQEQTLPFVPDSIFWLDAIATAGSAPSTVDCYARDLRDVAEAIGSIDISAVVAMDQSAADRVAELWSADGAAASTIYRRFAGLRNFARFLAQEGSHDCSKLLSCRLPPCGRVHREPVEKESIETILSTWDHEDSWTRMRDSAAIHVAATSALTTAEIVGLNLRDFSPILAAVLVRQSHLEPRPATISQEAIDRLNGYLDHVPFELGDDDPLFVTKRRTRLSARSFQLAFRRSRSLAGVSRSAVPTSLRNTIGFDLARSGAAPEVVAAALGIGIASAWRYFTTRDA
ncbi:integrase/recombinase XerC [Bradyrhizobium sp. USDA 4011]|jgi:integrase/recombinase XerC|uniref:tyrosine-type recombinase/integrase n=1 Tax=Bradyrhizobium TaxID=374 RepID=UPI0004877197|nr:MULTISPECIES: tyrosine-type recombinase/integrase [Bradyrhizobium]MCL8488270.1 tyrosine-type recombinase/integrase [Bradyrhizobium denitrificans]RTM15524.1 MAG: hypothetical protein EKK33_00790 [Bradyrhizobiaceae bacterium]